MTWTILVLIVGIALYVFGPMLLKRDGKKPTAGKIWAKKSISLVAIILIAGSVCRLYVPTYLVKVNPMIIQEMVESMQAKEAEVKNKKVREYIRENGAGLATDAPVMGNASAEKTIYVWTDFSCPYCRRVHNELDRVIGARDDVRVVVKNFSIHGALSDAPAKATIAAKLQSPEMAAELTDMLMTRDYYTQEDMKDQANLAKTVEANVMKMAKEVGLDTERLAEDMKGEVVAREMLSVRESAQKLEIAGTPYLLIGEQAFPGAMSAAQIQNALK